MNNSTKKLALLACTVLLTFTYSCSVFKKGGTKEQPFKTTESGIEYKILRDAKGDNHPVAGDFVELFISTKFEDSLIFDSRKDNNNKPVAFQIKDPEFHGDLSEAIILLTPGDSALFLVSVDSIIAGDQRVQPWMEKGKMVAYTLELVSIKTLEQLREEKKIAAGERVAKEEQMLKDYFKKNNINAKQTESGLFYAIQKEGTGDHPKQGQKVTVNYTGKLLDGTVFDSNLDPKFNHMEPLTFAVGQGQVISGWDEGLSLLKKGSKATLYIPSHLAYGDQSPTPAIPANSILIFDVSLLNIK